MTKRVFGSRFPAMVLVLTISGMCTMLFALAVKPAIAKSAAGLQKITVYSIAEQEQFIDNADDEARGWTDNPFGLRDRKVLAAETGDKGGPYPGDETLFVFNLYTGADLKTRAGSSTLTCLYYFNRNAYCDASYQINGGTLSGGGAFAFNATSFALAITGGTSRYARMTGEVDESPSGTRAQRLTFVIQPG